MRSFKEYSLLYESKQELISMGFPLPIAKLFYARFGKYTPLIAKWYKDYYTISDNKKNWYVDSKMRIGRDLEKLFYLQMLSAKDYEEMEAIMDDWDIRNSYGYDYEEWKREALVEITEFFNRDIFFRNSMIEDFENGKIPNIKNYKNLSFQEAQKKYTEKKLFSTLKPIKEYSNGYKWINVGPRCELVGKLMKNCGSTGVMSMDRDSTAIVLFDDTNDPRVITTYSPNEKRLSGDQGKASSEVKDEFHDYIMDLVDILGAKFDWGKSKSKALAIKSKFGNRLSSIDRIHKDTWNEYFKLVIDNNVYYTDGNSIISLEELKKRNLSGLKGLKTVFNYNTRPKDLEMANLFSI